MLAAITDRRSVRIADIPEPRPEAEQIVVSVRSAGLNRADLLDMDRASVPTVLGREFAGEIKAVGTSVGRWHVGDRVMGRGSGCAEVAVMDQSSAMTVPEALTWDEAGALPLALLTMHDALVTNGKLQPGRLVLIHAATSGVGVVGVRLAAVLGASMVIGTSRSGAKLQTLSSFVSGLSCPLIGVDTSAANIASAINEHTDGAGVDIIIDTIGASSLATNIAIARIGGRIIQVGRLGGGVAEIDLEELARKRITLAGVSFRTRGIRDVADVVQRCVTDVGSRLGLLAPRIERTYPLEETGRALEALGRNEHVGKLVVRPHGISWAF